MRELSSDGHKIVDDLALRYGVGSDAVAALLRALERGNGAQAQFNHPDLGGMGQWSQGGMIMIGDMFNQGLKHRVDALCREIANLVRSQPSSTSPMQAILNRKAKAVATPASVYSSRDPVCPRLTGGQPNSAAPPRPARRITCNMPASQSPAASQSARAAG